MIVKNCKWHTACCVFIMCMYLRREWCSWAQVGRAVPDFPHHTAFHTCSSYKPTRKTINISVWWIKPAGPTGATRKSSIQSPRHGLRSSNTFRRTSMRIHASAERGTCVELLGVERDSGTRRRGWSSGGETDDQPRAGGESWARVETDEVGVWSAESGLTLVKNSVLNCVECALVVHFKS